jgi:hypothetical protein
MELCGSPFICDRLTEGSAACKFDTIRTTGEFEMCDGGMQRQPRFNRRRRDLNLLGASFGPSFDQRLPELARDSQ